MIDDQQSVGRARADRWRWPVLGLALLSVRTGVRAAWLGGFAVIASTASLVVIV